ncbi:MAG: 4-oxalocrotonate tautomerase family protein [Candidatus Omnitrophica bacterium]|nr:4-oxalocrotonate tautomerase family protein [Candidatus Omnitrophota bacterium]
MPVITVDLFEGRTREQKEIFSKAVTDLAAKVLKAPVEDTWIVFRDHAKSDWAMGGKLCDG